MFNTPTDRKKKREKTSKAEIAIKSENIEEEKERMREEVRKRAPNGKRKKYRKREKSRKKLERMEEKEKEETKREAERGEEETEKKTRLPLKGKEVQPRVDPMLIIRPNFLSRMLGNTARMTRT